MPITTFSAALTAIEAIKTDLNDSLAAYQSMSGIDFDGYPAVVDTIVNKTVELDGYLDAIKTELANFQSMTGVPQSQYAAVVTAMNAEITNLSEYLSSIRTQLERYQDMTGITESGYAAVVENVIDAYFATLTSGNTVSGTLTAGATNITLANNVYVVSGILHIAGASYDLDSPDSGVALDNSGDSTVITIPAALGNDAEYIIFSKPLFNTLTTQFGTLDAAETTITLTGSQATVNGILILGGEIFNLGDSSMGATLSGSSITVAPEAFNRNYIVLKISASSALETDNGFLTAGNTTITVSGTTPSTGVLYLGGEIFDLSTPSMGATLTGDTITLTEASSFDTDYVIVKIM